MPTDRILTASRRFRGIADMAEAAACRARSRLTPGNPQDGAVKKRLHRSRLSAIIPIITASLKTGARRLNRLDAVDDAVGIRCCSGAFNSAEPNSNTCH